MKRNRSKYENAPHRFGILLFLFLGLMLCAPLFEGSVLAGYIGDTFYYLLLAAAAFSIRESRLFKLAVIFGLGAVVAEGISFIVERTSVLIVSNFIACAFLGIVTLLTIGYGDVVPMSGMAQSLTILEGLIGQFYLVFFMASLVGLYIYRRESGRPREKRDRSDVGN